MVQSQPPQPPQEALPTMYDLPSEEVDAPKIWMPGLELGLGLWQSRYRDHERLWLRWYGAEEGWMLTPEEQERQRAEPLGC